MGWKLLDKPKTVRVTKKLAQVYADMEPAPNDRPLSERRLAVYERIMREGGFRPVTWASALCKETDGVYRVNGKHTSTMLSGLDSLPEFFAVVEEYECDTLEDVAKLYATFDSSIQSRTASDIYLSFAGTVPELRDLPRKLICLAPPGIVCHLTGGTNNNSAGTYGQAAERAELLLEHAEFVLWMAEVLSSRVEGVGKEDRQRARHLFRSPVVGAMFACWGKAKGAAKQFWEAVRDESDPRPTDPTRKLARYLLTVGVDVGGGGSKRMRPVPPREMYAKCIHAWNAWRKGEDTSLRYYSDADVPAAK